MFLLKQKTILTLSLLLCSTLFAQTSNENSNSNNETSGAATELQVIEVRASKDVTGGGGGIPTPTRSITDALRSNSKVQYTQGARSSARGGEIAPPKISIRGSQHYENNFLINGVGNNNNINPAGMENNNPTGFAAGEAQSLFIDTSLIERIDAYTEAISAEYGGFTGGVIDAKLKNARSDRWHVMTNARYTQDSWAKFHLTDAQKNMDYPTSESYQPKFNKYEYALALDGPISEHFGLLVNYGLQRSKIPLYSGYNLVNPDNSTYKEQRTQYRENENYLVRLNTFDFENFRADLTAIYAPYTQELFRANVKNSDYDVENGGLDIIYNMQNVLNFGVLESVLSYKRSHAGINDSEYYAYTWRTTPNGAIKWNSSGSNAQEGSRGTQDLSKSDIGIKSSLYLDEIDIGETVHTIKTGMEAEYTKAKYKFDGGITFSNPELNSSAAGSKDDGIISGEQYAKSKMEYLPVERSKDYYTAALFLEDKIEMDRFTLRPGVRVSTDSLTDNIDVAPRLFANADIFDDGFLNLYGGYNRYYGTQILGYAVYKYQADSYTRANWDEPWILGAGYPSVYEYKHLKTPYSDEFSIGTSVNFDDTLLKLDYVNRKYRDQIKSRYDYVVATSTFAYENTNQGKTDYWGTTLTAAKKYNIGFTTHISELSATRSDTISNLMGFNSYQSNVMNNPGRERSPTHVTYNGELKLFDDLPASQFNSPWVITYTHSAQITDNLRVKGVAWYQKGGRGLRQPSGVIGLNDPSGLETLVYEEKRYKDVFNVDLTAHYDLKLGEHTLTFGLEVLNLLDRKNDASGTIASTSFATTFTDEYSMGRQFYASFRYEY
ncbi:MAG: TonB-dependent receptor plug domain-containing protein [Campylobacteraceae bacterium]|nr:TonB-dependent receptor plug domain-containing protein [Campylobacteraceae bacterium]